MQRIEQIKQMLVSEPQDDFLNYALAMEYMALAEHQKAFAIFSEILSRNKNYLAAYYQSGKCCEALNETEKAISIYKEGIKIAKAAANNKTLNELNEAVFMLEE